METVGSYRLLAPLGQGGMAAVHLAVKCGPAGFNKLVVVKQILPKYADEPEMVSMFLDEARLAARLNHPNLVQTNEVGVADGKHFLAMEYLDGQPLNRVLTRLAAHDGLPLALHLQIIAEILGGLHHAHELADFDGSSLGVVHGDVNPQNVFVTYDGVVKVIDFGVATARTALTKARPGIIKGKPSYMSPEQLTAEKLDRRADIFAVGVMLWEAATGTRPWRDVTRDVMVERVLAGQFPAPCVSNPAVSVELEAIILKALAFDRRSRYETAAELQAAIEDYLATLGGRVSPRELGRMIAAHFAPERAVIASLVEEQLDENHAAATQDKPAPSLDGEVSLAVALPMTVVVRDKDFAEAESRATRTTAPEGLPAPLGLADTFREGPALASSTARPWVRSAPARDVTLGSPVYDGPRGATRARGRSRVWAMLGAMAAGLLGIVAFGASTGASASLPTRAASAAAAPVVALDGGVDAMVEVQLSASPPEARLFLDGTLLHANPFRGDVPRDGNVHILRIEAPGCVTRSETVTFDKNRTVDVALAPEGPVQREPSPRAATRSSSSGAPQRVRISEW